MYKISKVYSDAKARGLGLIDIGHTPLLFIDLDKILEILDQIETSSSICFHAINNGIFKLKQAIRRHFLIANLILYCLFLSVLRQFT